MAASTAPPHPKEEEKMMVAIDDSECSHYALEWALRNLSPRRLLLLTVQPLASLTAGSPSPSPLGPLVVSPELMRSVREHQRQLAQALLHKAKAICAHHGVDAETVIEVGDPKETICEAAEKLNVHLLILGSHSRGPIQRFFLGSVSNYCTHHAKCPVLVVKKQE